MHRLAFLPPFPPPPLLLLFLFLLLLLLPLPLPLLLSSLFPSPRHSRTPPSSSLPLPSQSHRKRGKSASTAIFWGFGKTTRPLSLILPSEEARIEIAADPHGYGFAADCILTQILFVIACFAALGHEDFLQIGEQA
ncbi:uncharacterized protein LOC114671950 isoform X2 [Macaca mulatta]